MRQHDLQVERWRTNPYPREIGEAKARKFIASFTVQVEIMEMLFADGLLIDMDEGRRHALEDRARELLEATPPIYSVSMFFTQEQKDTLERLQARLDFAGPGEDDDVVPF